MLASNFGYSFSPTSLEKTHMCEPLEVLTCVAKIRYLREARNFHLQQATGLLYTPRFSLATHSLA